MLFRWPGFVSRVAERDDPLGRHVYARRAARTALSFHFAGGDFENVDSSLSESLLVDRPLPNFGIVCLWVSQSMLRFRGRDPLLERFTPVAHRLITESGGAQVKDHLPIFRANMY